MVADINSDSRVGCRQLTATRREPIHATMLANFGDDQAQVEAEAATSKDTSNHVLSSQSQAVVCVLV